MGLEPDELKERKNVSYGLVIWVGIICFNIGVLYASMLGAKDDIVKNHRAALDYTEQEVGGLRSDWERQNAILKNRDAEMLDRIMDLEKYHKQK